MSQPQETADCECLKCLRERGEHTKVGGLSIPVEATRMVVCQTCGNKRCPHSDDHRNACTDSNDPGQAGSRYA